MTDLPANPGGPPMPGDTPTDDDRQFRIDQVQHALANEVIEFDQVDDYFEQIYRATTLQELDAAVSSLPAVAQPPPPTAARHIAPAKSFALIGDIKIGGWLAFGPEVNATGFVGDIVIDVSSASIPPEGLQINARSLVGDTKIILPDGHECRAMSSRSSVTAGRSSSSLLRAGPSSESRRPTSSATSRSIRYQRSRLGNSVKPGLRFGSQRTEARPRVRCRLALQRSRCRASL